MDPNHQHVFIVRAVENADGAAAGGRPTDPPKKIVGQFFALGCLNDVTWQLCGLNPRMTWRIVPSLPAVSIPCSTSRRERRFSA